MAISKLTNEIIDAALLGFEEQKRKIDAQISELRALRTGERTTSSPGRRQMSAAGRKAIAEAQKKRWATQRDETGQTKSVKRRKKKRVLSAEGRAAIVAALKKRWAAKKAGAKK